MARRGKNNMKAGWQKLGALWESDKGNLTGSLQFLGIKSRIAILQNDFEGNNAPDYIIWAPSEIESPDDREGGRSTRKESTPRRTKKKVSRKKKEVEDEDEDEDEEQEDDDDDTVPF